MAEVDPAVGDGGVEYNTSPIKTTVPTVILSTTPEPESGLVHPVIGYLVCVIVLLVFGTAIGLICFRHYRRKKTTTLKLTDDEEAVFSFEPTKKSEVNNEPVKTVILKRNGRDSKSKESDADDEATPMLSGLQDSEPLSEPISVELLKYTKKTEELPMIDETEENEINRSHDKLTGRETPVEPHLEGDNIDQSVKEVPHTAGDSDRLRNMPLKLERDTLTESQVLEMLDDAEEEDFDANRASVEVTAVVHTPTEDNPTLPTEPDTPLNSHQMDTTVAAERDQQNLSNNSNVASSVEEVVPCQRDSAAISQMPNCRGIDNRNSLNNCHNRQHKITVAQQEHLNVQDHTTHV